MIAVGGSEFDLASLKPCSTSISPDSKKESREDIGSSVKAFETDNVFARSFGRDAVIVLASEGLRCLFTYVDLPSFGYDVGESNHTTLVINIDHEFLSHEFPSQRVFLGQGVLSRLGLLGQTEGNAGAGCNKSRQLPQQ